MLKCECDFEAGDQTELDEHIINCPECSPRIAARPPRNHLGGVAYKFKPGTMGQNTFNTPEMKSWLEARE